MNFNTIANPYDCGILGIAVNAAGNVESHDDNLVGGDLLPL